MAALTVTSMAAHVTKQKIWLVLALWVAAVTLTAPKCWGQTSVLTQDYDNARSGANLSETILSPSSVAVGTFGHLFSFAVDEEIFTQPLYMPNVTINGAAHNVVFVSTNGNSVYAFDGDDPGQAATPLWETTLGTPIPSSRYFFSAGFAHVGIFGTPVIDPASQTLYVIATAWNTTTQSSAQYLHALDITSGAEKFGGPVAIAAAGFAADSNLQRPGLLLLNGVVYIAFGSHGDLTTDAATDAHIGYNGLVLAYDAGSLQLLNSFNAEPGGIGASFWQAGRGLASDGSFIYGMTGNAKKLGTNDYAESFVKLNEDLSVADNYQDPNVRCLDRLDLDLSASGPTIIPGTGTNLLLGGGKQGKVTILSLNQTLKTQTPSSFWATTKYAPLPADGGTCKDSRPDQVGWISSTAFWQLPGGGTYYVWGAYDELASYQLRSNNTLYLNSSNALPNEWPNSLAISANGTSDGILWAVAPQSGAAGTQASPASILYAFNASASGQALPELWDSSQNAVRDAMGGSGRFAVPTVANGKVYIASESNQVYVYGLLPTTTPSFQLTANSPTIHSTVGKLGLVTQTLAVNALGNYTGSVRLSVAGGLPAGVSAVISPTTVLPGQTAKMTIKLSGAHLPMQDIYTILVSATDGVVTRYLPMRFEARFSYILAPTDMGCDPSKNMSIAIPLKGAGMGHMGLWLQDPKAPIFPGHLWAAVAPQHSPQTLTTGHWISSTSAPYYLWVFDRSNGAPANFDNALRFLGLNAHYDCE